MSNIDWDTYYKNYDLGVGTLKPYQTHLRQVANLADLQPGLRVLETGCGSGQLLQSMLRVQSDLHLTGIDFNELALAHARRKFTNGESVRFLQADLNESHWGVDPGYDRVVSSMVLYALKDPEGYLRTVRSRIREGGLFVLVNLWDRGAVMGILDEHKKWLDEEATHEECTYDAHPDVQAARAAVIEDNKRILAREDLHAIPPSDLQEMLQAAGFSVEFRQDRHYAGCAVLIAARAV